MGEPPSIKSIRQMKQIVVCSLFLKTMRSVCSKTWATMVLCLGRPTRTHMPESWHVPRQCTSNKDCNAVNKCFPKVLVFFTGSLAQVPFGIFKC
jgi:hypothetical protein